jgi:hypothetical protein
VIEGDHGGAERAPFLPVTSALGRVTEGRR